MLVTWNDISWWHFYLLYMPTKSFECNLPQTAINFKLIMFSSTERRRDRKREGGWGRKIPSITTASKYTTAGHLWMQCSQLGIEMCANNSIPGQDSKYLFGVSLWFLPLPCHGVCLHRDEKPYRPANKGKDSTQSASQSDRQTDI